MMKTPHGLIYAILIIVAILAVTLFARCQSSQLAATATIHTRTPPPELAVDNAGAVAKEESGSKEVNPKPDDDASK